MKSSPPPMPAIDDRDAAVIVDFLQHLQPTQRSPEASAKVLAFIVTLHLRELAWNTWSREAIATHLDVSLPLVDVCLSQRRAQGLITKTIRAVQGKVRRRPSTVSLIFMVPSSELLGVVLGRKFRAA